MRWGIGMERKRVIGMRLDSEMGTETVKWRVRVMHLVTGLAMGLD